MSHTHSTDRDLPFLQPGEYWQFYTTKNDPTTAGAWVGYSKPDITKIYTPATQSSVGSGPGKVDPTNRLVGRV